MKGLPVLHALAMGYLRAKKPTANTATDLIPVVRILTFGKHLKRCNGKRRTKVTATRQNEGTPRNSNTYVLALHPQHLPISA